VDDDYGNTRVPIECRAAGKTHSLDLRQAFRFGYVLARTRKFKEAAPVFEMLMRSDDGRSLAMIMLAYCKAGLRDYAACSELLKAAFPDDATGKADQLHAAFVYLSLRMYPTPLTSLSYWPGMPGTAGALPIVGRSVGFTKGQSKAIRAGNWPLHDQATVQWR